MERQGGLFSFKEKIYAFRNCSQTSHRWFAQHSASGEAAVVESGLQTPPPDTWSNSGLMEVLPLCKISSEQVNSAKGNSAPVTSIICAFYDILQCDCLMSIMFALHCQFVILENYCLLIYPLTTQQNFRMQCDSKVKHPIRVSLYKSQNSESK